MDSDNEGGLLSILLKDPIFENETMIVDECLTFFLAGSMTSASATANTLCYLILNNSIEKKVRDSLYKNFTKFTEGTL